MRRLPYREPDWLDEAHALRAQGLKYSSIANRLDLPYDEVYHALTREVRLQQMQDRKESFVCPDCGDEFKRLASRLGEGRCPKCSSNRKQSRKVKRICRACKETFYVRESEGKRGGVYCSRDCWKDDPPRWTEERRGQIVELMRDREGRKNPNYRHGQERIRRVFNITKKGERQCRVCGVHDNIHLHHAIPRSMCKATRENLLNGIPLCAACHLSWHRRGKVVVYRDRFTCEEWEFISSVELQGFVMATWLDERYPDRGLPFFDEVSPRRGWVETGAGSLAGRDPSWTMDPETGARRVA